MKKRIAIRCYHSLRHPRGFVLITVTWITIALAAVVLVLAREMMVESMTARQQLDQAKADAAELGMEQFVRSVLEQEYTTPGYKDSVDWELRRVGDCYCWVITHNMDDDTQYAFGLTDEASKVDLNTATPDMLMMLPNMDENTAYNIANWANLDVDNPITGADGTVGASNSDYEQYNYRIKGSPFESVEELRLVVGNGDKGVIDDYLLYGADLNHNGVLEPEETSSADSNESSATSMLGIRPFVTVQGLRATLPPLAATASSTTSTTPTSGGGLGGGSSSASGATTGAISNLDSNGNPITIADINASSNTVLTAVLTQFLPDQQARITSAMQNAAGGGGGGGRGGGGAGGGGATLKKYKNVWDWATQMQTAGILTPDTFAQVYPYLICTTQTTSTTTTTTQVAGGITGGASTTPTPPTGPVGRININTAPLAVLECIPGFEEADAQAIIDYRNANLGTTDPSQVSNIAWLLNQVDPQKLVQAGYYLTGSSKVYSADIVTVSLDGRAFKRVKIVVDISTGTPQMLYRRDLTSAGWPLPAYYRDNIKAVYRGESGVSLDRLGPSPTVSGSSVVGVK